MQSRFEFEGSEVAALLDESDAAPVRLMTQAQQLLADEGVELPGIQPVADIEESELEVAPGLWLMNDGGVYLRSNARDRPGEQVAFARGYRADVPLGDEPLCEFIDGAPLRALLPDDTLVVTLSEQKIRLSLIRKA